MKLFIKYMVSLLALVQVLGCSAMDLGESSNIVLKNASGYAIEVVAAYHNNQHRRVIIDPGQEENLGPISNLVSFKYAGYGEVWAKTSLWNEYSSEQVDILRQNQQVGIDLVLTISTWLQKFLVEKQVQFMKQQIAGAVEKGEPQKRKQEGMLILKWFPRVHAKLLQQHSSFVLSNLSFAEMIDVVKEGQEIKLIKDYYFLRLPPDATRDEVESEYKWLVEQVTRSLTRLDEERAIVLRLLSEAKDSMLKKLK